MDLTGALVAWYDQHARDLPWRRLGVTPWGVLVSEFMLQQTPVARVAPVWSAWMLRWPQPSDLAAAPAGDAVRAWGRLGYPRRALRLHECARLISRQHGGTVPDDRDALLALPGVGAYTARAVVAFAFGQRHPVVDVNVRRVVARLVHGRGQPGAASPRRDHGDVDALLPDTAPLAARLSIALMELGATVCRAAAPTCTQCPVADACAWRRAGYPPAADRPARAQPFPGTDREVRGRLLDVVRTVNEPVERARLDLVWPEPVQRDRALHSLIVDGLVVRRPDGHFALPGGADCDPGGGDPGNGEPADQDPIHRRATT
ncbi:MAG: A/G-specific adenine glycosylase [bacterium]